MVDEATGLPNRAALREDLAKAFARSVEEPAVLLIASVDRMSAVRDGYGSAFGEEVLREAAARIRRASDNRLTAYLGADEFAVVVLGPKAASHAAALARRLLVELQAPFTVKGQRIYCDASVGIACHPRDGDAASLVRNAAVAASHARASRGERLAFYDSRMQASAAARLELESALRRALERDEFVLHYQPRVASTSGRPAGFEALLRWQHPGRGILLPAEFIDVLEDTGAIAPVGEWVLRRACEQLVEWRSAGLAALPVSVNLSASQFRHAGLEQVVARIIAETNVDPELVEIEITESSLMHDPEDAVRTLRHLRSYGIKLSVDDFGTGHSSLAYLRRFPLHTLKIDRAFVRDATTSGDAAAITHAIVQLAHTLGLRVTAEGVETPEQRDLLNALGCDEMQGFLFAAAMPPEQAAALLSRRL